MLKTLESLFRANRVFLFLVFYRWASLLPAVFSWNHSSSYLLDPRWVIMLALSANMIVSLFNRKLNKLVMDHPIVLGIDMLFAGLMLSVSGGTNSPYYLNALSPLMAGAFFFQMRGALTVSAFLTPIFLLANYFSASAPNPVLFASELVGIWLFPILYAFPSTLLRDISRARGELSNARDELAEKHENLVIAHRQLE